MKKFLLFLMLLAVPADAALVYIGAGLKASVGDTIVVPIKATYLGRQRFNAMRAVLSYNPIALQYFNAAVAPGFRAGCGDIFQRFQLSDGKLVAQVSYLGSGCTRTKAGEVVRVWFIAKEAGLTDLRLDGQSPEPGGGGTGLFDEGPAVPTKIRNTTLFIRP